MKNKPLGSSERAKVLAFSMLLLPSILFLFGIIPTSVLIFGIYMMKKNKDFSNMDAAIKGFKAYAWIGFILSACFSAYWGWKFLNIEDKWFDDDLFYGSLIALSISSSYLFFIQNLLLSPLKKHSEWVANNGIFSTDQSEKTNDIADYDINIIRGENLKQYSVADEMIKWVKLKEDGHISEEEFNKARTKLFKKS